MTEQEKAAKEAEAAAAKQSANGGDALTPEQLRAAQDKAEEFRKEAEDAREELEEKQRQYDALLEKTNKSQAEKDRLARLAAGITDDEALVSQLEEMAARGDATARAYLKKMEKMANEIADKKIEEKLAKIELNRDFDARDELLENLFEQWNNGKDEKDQLSLDEFQKMVGSHADPGLKGTPLRQLKTAWQMFQREQKLIERERKQKEADIKNGQFRDNGSNQFGEGDKKKGPGSWRDAKTPQEKEAQLATL